MKQDEKARMRLVAGTYASPVASPVANPPGGLVGWLLARLRSGGRPRPRLELVERIALAPRQSLSLIEAEGRRFLVATSAEGSPAFYPLDERPCLTRSRGNVVRIDGAARLAARLAARVSW
jgi:hypothetical protein